MYLCIIFKQKPAHTVMETQIYVHISVYLNRSMLNRYRIEMYWYSCAQVSCKDNSSVIEGIG